MKNPENKILKNKPKIDLRFTHPCAACGAESRPLKRVWGPKKAMRRYQRRGYVKWCGVDIDWYGAPYECRHCEAPWWVWGLVWVKINQPSSLTMS